MKKVKVVDTFELTWYNWGSHSRIKTESGHYALGNEFRGGHFLIEELVERGAPLGAKIRVTLEVEETDNES